MPDPDVQEGRIRSKLSFYGRIRYVSLLRRAEALYANIYVPGLFFSLTQVLVIGQYLSHFP